MINGIKSICFDIFGVLLRNKIQLNLLGKKREHLPINENTVRNFWQSKGIADFNKYRTNTLRGIILDVDYFDVIAMLSQNYHLGIISNTSESTFSTVNKFFGITRAFSPILYSGKTDLSKPDHRIYEQYLDIVKLNPEQVLFIDDKIPNLAGAHQVGMKTFWVTQNKNAENYYAKPESVYLPDYHGEGLRGLYLELTSNK